MTNEVLPEIYEAAADWLVRNRSGVLADADKQAFDDWMRKSPEHIRAYLELTCAWEETDALTSVSAPDAGALITRAAAKPNVIHLAARDREQDHLSASAERGRAGAAVRPGGVKWYAIAATLVMAFAAGFFAYHRWYANVYSTDTGEQRTVSLGDGSTVVLNAQSRVRIDYTEAKRSVELLAGQAIFRVAHNPSRPFIVDSGGTLIRAVGTQFDVYRKPTGTVVTVIEGKVAIANEGAQGAATAVQSMPAAGIRPAIRDEASGASSVPSTPSDILLTAGEQIVVSQNAAPIATPVNVESATAWTQQRLVFYTTPLTQVAEEFNRYNKRHIIVDGARLAAFNISGTFSSTDPTLLLKYLRTQPGIVVTETDDQIRISQSP